MPSSTLHPPRVGKLVSVTRRQRPPATPLEVALPARDPEVPWLIVATMCGVGAWLVVLALLAVSGMSGPRRHVEMAGANPIIVEIEHPAPAVEDEVLQRPAALAAGLERRPAPGLPDPPPLAPLPAEEPAIAPPPGKAACAADQLGTDICFVKHPPDAFRQARKDGKLVFMVHLSGNFEDREFT